MAKSLPARVTVSPDTLFQEVTNEAVLLNLATEQYYILDDVGMRMWQLLAAHHETELVVEKLLGEYDADESTIRQDLAELIEKLTEVGLLTAVPAES